MVKSPFEDEIPPSWLVVAATRDGVLVYEADGAIATPTVTFGR